MRKLIASVFVTTDGFMSGPGDDMSWVLNNFNEEMAKYAGDLMSSMDAVLLGRLTYDIMVKAWPDRTEATARGADAMNKHPKIVLSRTLERAPWGKWDPARLIKANVESEIKTLKQQPGKNIVIYGSANAVQNLTQLGLIDEYQLLVHPVLLGNGKPLFKPMPKPLKLKLLRTDAFNNGVTVLYYQPNPA